MGGRGASSIGATAKTGLTLDNGNEVIEFDGKLMYYGDDKSVTGKVRENIEAWEAKRGNAKIEYAYSVDAEGNPIGTEVKGGKGSVRPTYAMLYTENNTFTHIHPRDKGLLGGTFSGTDLYGFASEKSRTIRAKAKEGTYSMTKTSNFKGREFSNYIRECENKFIQLQKNARTEINKNYRSGKISYEEAIKASNKIFNSALVELHNMYKSGEKKYGYKYTLEPLKKGK